MQSASCSEHLGLFPATSRVATGPCLEAVLQTQPGAMLAPSSARTVSARQLHHLCFCRLVTWTDNWLIIGDDPDLAMRGQLQLAMCAAVHLTTGNSICCRQIKAAAVEQHVVAAATFLAHFTGRDFRKDLPTDSSMGHLMGPVHRDLRSCEPVPERREPYNLRMHALGCVLASSQDTNSLLPALMDGFEQGLCAGCRLSEWAQPADHGQDATQPLDWQPDANPCHCTC